MSEYQLPFTFATAPPGGFAASYEPTAKGNFVFLNPGDELCFVGGGALNGAVGKMLMENGNQTEIPFELDEEGKYKLAFDEWTQKDCPVYHREKCTYAALHTGLFAKAKAEKEKMIIATPAEIEASGAPVVFAAGRTHSNCERPFGAAFLTIFKPDKVPFGNPQNCGQLYVVGALGVNKKAEGEGAVDEERHKFVLEDPKDFLEEIYLTGKNAASLILEYNALNTGTKVEVLRTPVVAGGTFINPGCTAFHVALALIWGMHAALAEADPALRPALELMPGKAFEEAAAEYQSNKKPEDWNTEEGKSLFAKIPPPGPVKMA